MKIIRVSPRPDYWEVLLENGDIYLLWRKDVIEFDNAYYGKLLDYLGTITFRMETSEAELKANGFHKKER